MAVEIQKLEAAARIAMGHFEGADAVSVKRSLPRSHAAYGLLALASVVALAFVVL
jgi:hypothetical protein